jgi:hypothetical protein
MQGRFEVILNKALKSIEIRDVDSGKTVLPETECEGLPYDKFDEIARELGLKSYNRYVGEVDYTDLRLRLSRFFSGEKFEHCMERVEDWIIKNM